MTLEFRCKYGCGTLLHFDPDTRRVVDGGNTPHYCRQSPPKVLLSFDEFEQGLARMIENTVKIANTVSRTTTYEVTSRPKVRENQTT
jgi:hypothetical protein